MSDLRDGQAAVTPATDTASAPASGTGAVAGTEAERTKEVVARLEERLGYRFKERELAPQKQYKITEEDWRNRDKWQDYELAIDDMVSRTSTSHAPWTLVAGNDKRFARIQILKTFCKNMQAALKNER